MKIGAFGAALALLFVGAVGCESGTGSGSSGSNGPYTTCTYNYNNGDTSLKGFGEQCSADSECAFGECMMPGDSGNITNNQFGFCTRGCDCNDDETSRLSEQEKVDFECIYPPTPDQDSRHMVIECSGLSDCQAYSGLYTECSTSSGTARKVCKAL